jgi:hypothetical protein
VHGWVLKQGSSTPRRTRVMVERHPSGFLDDSEPQPFPRCVADYCLLCRAYAHDHFTLP